jgi:ParB/RepB/Spo0J family partition protein
MTKLTQSLLLEEATPQADEKLLTLMRRLGIEALPAHETMALPLERIIVPGASLIARHATPLVKSIKKVGILQAPTVVLCSGTALDDPQATFEVVMGRRRVLAARLAELTVIKCEAYTSGTPQLSALLALIENEQRSAAWIKEVEDLHRLIDEGVGMSLDDLAEFGFHRGTLAERLKMAQLPLPILTQIFAGRLSQDVVRKIARLTPTQQERIAQLALAGEEITAEAVKNALRLQVNSGFAPLQTALTEAWETLPVTHASERNGQQPDVQGSVSAGSNGGVPSPAPELAHVLVMLQRFEPQTRTNPVLSRIGTLTQVLIKELQIVLRQPDGLIVGETTPDGEGEVNHV